MDLQHINLLDLLGGDFKQKTHDEYAGPCPFCGGTDRFIVWTQPDQGNPRFWCRQCTISGDAIDLLVKRDNLSFAEAIERLGVTTHVPSRPTPRRQAPRKKLVSEQGEPAALADPAWQQAALSFVETSVHHLWQPQGKVALNYLHQRGLADEVIRTAQLGFNPTGTRMTWGSEEVWLHAGIVIPWLIESHYWKVNIRRRPSELKPSDNRYQHAKGSANGLYGADALCRGCTAIMVEGEFDALSIASNVPAHYLETYRIVPVATGSVSGAHLLRWVAKIAQADRIILAFDADSPGDANSPGEKAAEYWKKILKSRAVRLRPTQHDVTDMVKAGENLSDWIASAGF